jgi:hypothetical protein
MQKEMGYPCRSDFQRETIELGEEHPAQEE